MNEIKLDPFLGLEAFKKRNAERRLNEQAINEPQIKEQKVNEDIELKPIGKKVEERWTVYKFTLPARLTKKIATGFESKDEAKIFIEKKLTKRDSEGNRIIKYMKFEDDKEYIVAYDTILESREEVDIYYNEPLKTTVGNDREKALERYMEESPELEIIRDVRWIG